MERIQQLLDSFVEKHMAVGTSVLICKDGQEAFYGQAGKRHQEEDTPFDRDTIMLMYSMTKVVTAVAAMTLMDKGIFTPDTPVYEFIPEYKTLQVAQDDGTLQPAATPLTIHHLLTMTSGIPYPDQDNVVTRAYMRMLAQNPDMSRMTTLNMTRQIAGCPLHFNPGEHWRYGLSADVLGGVIIAATGLELGEYMRQTIFDPLGMHDTHFRVPAEKQNRVAGLYHAHGDGTFSPYTQLYTVPGVEQSQVELGGGGLYSTLDDFARFGEMLRKGGEGILSPESFRMMTSNQLSDALLEEFWDYRSGGYGYGYLVRTLLETGVAPDHKERIGAFGWNGMGGTSLRIDPARGLTVVYGIQRVPSNHNDFLPPLMQTVADVFGE